MVNMLNDHSSFKEFTQSSREIKIKDVQLMMRVITVYFLLDLFPSLDIDIYITSQSKY